MYLSGPDESPTQQIERLTRQRDDARGWARGFLVGDMWDDLENAESWLVDRFDENGDPCDAYGRRIAGEPTLW